MLKQRIMTALVLLPLVMLLIFSVPLDIFTAVIAAITYLLALEWGKLAGLKVSLYCTLYALAVSAINLTLWKTAGDVSTWPSLSWPNQLVWDYPMIILAGAVVATLIAIFIVTSYSRLPRWWATFSFRALLGLLLLSAFFVSIISIRSVGIFSDLYQGGFLLLLMFGIIWGADTGAYLAGKTFGKNKLAPFISPNKTIEGAIGGILLSVSVAWLGAYLLNLNIDSPVLYSLIALFLAILSVLGDLFESALKRAENIKDSGKLLPGHGGILDRLDSSIVVAPAFYLLFSYFRWLL